jgi:hypothetical protein
MFSPFDPCFYNLWRALPVRPHVFLPIEVGQLDGIGDVFIVGRFLSNRDARLPAFLDDCQNLKVGSCREVLPDLD